MVVMFTVGIMILAEYDDDINAINVETGTPGTLLLHRGAAQETHR